MKISTIFFLICLCTCQFACKKNIFNPDDDADTTPMTEEEKLPPITEEGANTFGCLVDGEVWLPKGGNPLNPNFDVYYDEEYFHRVHIGMLHQTSDSLPNQHITISMGMIGNTPNIDFSQNRNVFLTGFSSCPRYEKILEENYLISKLDTISEAIKISSTNIRVKWYN